ncbi:MAG: 50S ribosomal protein L7/L12 [Candidatus Staskawiczbacteria bacterium RIFCSPHIGHO2_02_FULL_42_22]|uniref:Large ribosomal subunit protein bL12 n=1 Tax=Candidatus Staskawiczbacteria bacterium RIFCSPHIGHO2_02_FULL_42_22 TaxID=1802207 RepID=A0A1G2I0V6_9BACT|nr:MAG: 50S ribosomal protein L7/L12 [Candidatus Staskawiczbacteria bacterium RIFCSPHIGHO2_02_FULL_42_22]
MAEEKQNIEVPEKFKDLVKKVEEMSIVELAELVKVLEGKFGVSAAAPVAVAAAAGPAEEAKTSFNVELKEVGAQKIEVIKVVRDITQKGLKESKDLVDAAAAAPQMVKEGVKKEEADEMKKKFEAAGAKVEIK